MECSRCPLAPIVHAFTAANVDKSFGRIKSKQIHSAVAILKEKMENVCSCCSPLSKKVDKQIAKVKAAWNEQNTELFRLVMEAEAGKEKAVEELQSAFSAVCLVCSRDSNDDNPSNHGQVFYSLDSGSCNSNSGKAGNSATDDNVVLSRADWIGSHAAPDYNPTSYGADPRIALMKKEEPALGGAIDNQGVSSLPSDIEDTLRKEFSNFAGLDIIDKMLLSCIISGMNIAEFAKMLWLPFSIVNPQDHTIHSITKQAAHARWTNIIKKFPNFASIAVGGLARSKGRSLTRREMQQAILYPNSEKPDNQFSNGKLQAKPKKSIRLFDPTTTQDPTTTPTTTSTKTRIKRNLHLSASDAVRPQLKKVKALSRKNKNRVKPEDCIPGLECCASSQEG